MAVSLGPNGLSGDKGGTLITDTTWSGSTTSSIGINLPSGYDWYEIFASITGTHYSVDRGRLYQYLKDTSGNQLSIEHSTFMHHNNNSYGMVSAGANIWQKIGEFIDMNTDITAHIIISRSGSRPGVLAKYNYTYGGIGSTCAHFTGHSNAGSITYGEVGWNVDNSTTTANGNVAITEIDYRVIGYTS